MKLSTRQVILGAMVMLGLGACGNETYEVETVTADVDVYPCTPEMNKGTTLSPIDCVSLAVDFDREINGEVIEDDLLSLRLHGQGLGFWIDKGIGSPLCGKAPWDSSTAPAIVGFEFHYMGDSGNPEFWFDCEGQTIKQKAFVSDSKVVLPWPKTGTIEYTVGLHKMQMYDSMTYTYLEGTIEL